ncbi:hypothetical protein Nans01_25110 [Nocardiopsis ansamitocini]|uniref:Methoxymalonate biosynthesis protein n=1 Tax=Nocardiopsis ansamitocini TaxID=1670832 RepID=A0A9W6P663_9ACTN|nr:hypothetical protein Nans01_25110 [Nocardiopsis ansamitocini]
MKCLVWDLDNTLWQGILLEDETVTLPEAVLTTIRALDARGILQSVASKNDHETAWEQLHALGVAEFFVLPEIGWGVKSASVRRIAEQLGFAHSTIAFIDDQPAERAEVAFHLPDVRCYPAEQATRLSGLPEFTPATTTVDSQQRRRLYQAGFERAAERASFAGPDEDFLRSLELVLCVARASGAELSRVEELTLRTSQMNATGVHYPDAELRRLLTDPAHEVLVATLADRFGPHGAVGVLLVHKHREMWHLKLLATSCRVVSFGVGTVIVNWLVDQASRAGVHLVADFRPTDRNRIMEVAYRFAGFGEEECACHLVPADASPGVLRLHLTPAPRPAPTTMLVEAPDLAEREGMQPP